MNKFVRGGAILTVLSLCVVFLYAQTKAPEALSSAKDSQKVVKAVVDSNIDLKEAVNNTNKGTEKLVQDKDQDQDKNKKVKGNNVEKTVSTRSTAGSSRGSFTATAYCLRGKTALGHGVRKGLIAADPRVLRLGSRVNIGAGQYSGEYLVSDTGGRIKGRKIDIWMASCAEARRFGRRTVTISGL
ncbi:MAG: 3D domain-containing protein [Pyrinomonadaceae bacterium]